MRVWYDACTGKHVRYGVAVAQRLRGLGHEVVLTTRKHPDTIELAKLLGEKPKIIGEYSPTSSYSRLKQSLERQLDFCRMFANALPDHAISHGSVDLCRVAFGLGVPTISTADAPHASAANRLALPLVDVVLTSKAIPSQVYERFGARNVIQFDGVDEVAWVKNLTATQQEHEKPLIVVRQMETRASYAKGKPDLTEQLAKRLTSLGDVLFIPRYDTNPRPEVIVPQEFVDSASISGTADLVLSVGGTISREAALQGTPSIVIRTFGRSYVNDYLHNKKFPIFTVEPSQVLKVVSKHLGQRWNTREQMSRLEDPVDHVERITQTKH